MHFKIIATVAALATSAVAGLIPNPFGNDVNIDVMFSKYTSDDCTGEVVGDVHKLDADNCKNFDHEFRSFDYDRRVNMMLPFHHDDYLNEGCQVIVYSGNDCLGDGYSLGSFADTVGHCGRPLNGGIGRSASVICREGNSRKGRIGADAQWE